MTAGSFPCGSRAGLAALLLGIASAHALEESGPTYQITIHVVWGSAKEKVTDPALKLPRELEKVFEKLKARARNKFFRLDAQPITRELTPGKPIEARLPDGTRVSWVLKDEKGKAVVEQTVSKPGEEKSVVVHKKIEERTDPRVNVIHQGEESLFLVVQFGRTPSPDKRK